MTWSRVAGVLYHRDLRGIDCSLAIVGSWPLHTAIALNLGTNIGPTYVLSQLQT